MATLAIWHGYLLTATGSNIYTSALAQAWLHQGHDVILICQEPRPERIGWISRLEEVDGETLRNVTDLGRGNAPAGHGTCIMVRPDIGGVLPVYVLDRYEHFPTVKCFVDCFDGELQAYTAAHAAALRGVLGRHRVDGVLIGHGFPGPSMLRPVLDEAGIPYAVKVHGSELEYAIVRDARFVADARRGLEGARTVLVGSRHIEHRTVELLGQACVDGRVEVAPPGVDIDLFRPAADVADRAVMQASIVASLRTLEGASVGRRPADEERLVEVLDAAMADPAYDVAGALRDLHGAYDERQVEQGAADGIAAVDLTSERIVTYVGKAIRQKGTQLLLAAMPLVLDHHPDVRLLMVGFGGMREGQSALLHALGCADPVMVDRVVAGAAAIDGGADAPWEYLPAFFDRLARDADLSAHYWRAARTLPERTIFTGLIGHDELSRVWPLCEVAVVPSILAEAFGMVAAEAAACGCPPLVAHHSGLAEVADAIDEHLPAALRGVCSFDLGVDDPVMALASAIDRILSLDARDRARLHTEVRAAVTDNWSWDAIATRVASLLIEA